ncbi:amidohydrolase family protein [Candidatus Bipolaricaulota bacterium]
MANLLIESGALIEGPGLPLRVDWGVAVEGNRIADVGPNASLKERHQNAEVIEAEDLVLFPGFVNSHMHAYGLLAHGIPMHSQPKDFRGFLEDFWWPRVENRLDRRMIRAAMAMACVRMIRSGYTSFCDILEAPLTAPGILDAEESVVRQAGLRAVLSIEVSERLGGKRAEEAFQENVRFMESHLADDLVSGMMSLHTSFTCSEDLVARAKEAAVSLDSLLHVHLSESPYEPEACLERWGVRPVTWYERLGVLDERFLASQVVAVDEEEVTTLAESGAQVAHMPLSNCEVGGGVSPVPEMIRQGIRPGLGSDGYINSAFEVMRGAFLIHKGVERDGSVMPAETVLDMATRWGAQAIGLPAVGEIEAGKPADIVGVRSDFDTPATDQNIATQLVLFRGAHDVALSMVDGRILMKEGELVTMEETACREEAAAEAKRLWRGTNG